VATFTEVSPAPGGPDWAGGSGFGPPVGGGVGVTGTGVAVGITVGVAEGLGTGVEDGSGGDKVGLILFLTVKIAPAERTAKTIKTGSR